MNRRSVLWVSVAILLSIAAIGAAVPLFSYLSPSAKAYADLPRFKLPKLEPNSYAYVPHPHTTSWENAEILIVKRANGEIDFWHIPTIDGKHAIPDYYWWRAGWPCDDFSPDFKKKQIYCKDPSVYPPDSKWSLEGKDLSNNDWIPDLERVPGSVILGDFVVYHPNRAEG